MLVEDDKSLREIYGVRLLAEGYDIVSAGDGEEALAMAIKERPTLIITDVMMPKISGFDMLDILRSTTETKNIKVIVMTALGSEEQRLRGDQLGADRYLVKSQVGIEDVVRTVHDVLGDQPTAAPAAVTAPPVAAVSPAAARMAAPVAPAQPTPGPQPSTQRAMASTPMQPPASAITATPSQQAHFSMPPTQQAPVQPPVGRNRVIQPLSNAATSRVDINELLDRELAKEAGIDLDNRPPVASSAQEKQLVQGQISQFGAPPEPTAVTPVSDTAAPTQDAQSQPSTPTIQIDEQGNVSMPGPATPTPVVQPPVPPTSA